MWGIGLNVKYKKFAINSQLIIGFLLFTAIIVALLWFFQIGLLNNFYKGIKHQEIRNTAESIEQKLHDGDLLDFLQNTTKSTGIDVMITDNNGYKIVQVTTGFSAFFANLTPDICAAIYAQTLSSGGEYTEWVDSQSGAYFYNDFEEIVYVKATEKNSNHLIILNTRVTPVDSTVETLKFQLWALTGAMVVMSIVLALLISRKISKPIENINDAAKKMALGDFETIETNKGSREISELATTLNYTANELSKVENLRRELIANVSHDLRTPLTMISGYAEVMRDIPGENSPENVQVIIDEAARLTNLVNDLLDISKLEAGEMKYTPRSVNLTESIISIIKRYDKLADYTFDFYHGDDIYVLGDELKLSQVVYNLVNNAINYTGEDKRVVLTQTIIDGFVKIEVSDSGEGIDPDKINLIWERYYKLEKSHKRAQIGTGLGLSIVKKVIDLHGGTCGAESEPHKGSTFWFMLPLSTSEEEEGTTD